MVIDLIPIEKFIMVNRLQEVTNPIVFDKGNIPTEDGLLSTSIFGINSYERKRIYAFIDLKTRLFHPIVFKSLLRMERGIEGIIQGSKKYIIDDKGQLVEDEEKGNTGIDWLYNNWNKIKWKRNDSRMRNERIDLLEEYDRNTIFVNKWIVIPAFYRDVNLSTDSDSKVDVHIMTQMYSQLMRYASIIESSNGFDFMINSTKYQMQLLLVEIYDELKGKIEKKNGLIKKSLMGKSVDYSVRTVISSPSIGQNTSDDLLVDAEHTGIPLFMVCTLLTPFIIHNVKNFLRRELEGAGDKYPVIPKGKTEPVYVKLKDPQLYFNEEYIEKALDRFVHSPYTRFEKIELPIDPEAGVPNKEPFYLAFRGKFYQEGVPETESPLVNRPATWTDIFYIAAEEAAQGKYVYCTRYPITDITSGIFPSKISVLSTMETMPVFLSGRVYPHYPVINPNLDSSKVPSQFRETTTTCNIYLKAMNADYDYLLASHRVQRCA